MAKIPSLGGFSADVYRRFICFMYMDVIPK